jgi:hypothetical protein
VNGKENATLRDIVNLLERSLGKTEGSTKQSLLLPFVEYVEEFFVGIAHDRNMVNFAKEFNNSQPNLTTNDFFHKFNLQHQNSLEKEYIERNLSVEELVHPILSNYKLTSLD